MMDQETKELYNSLTPEEKRQLNKNLQKEAKETLGSCVDGVKGELHQNGLVGTLIKGLFIFALDILTGK